MAMAKCHLGIRGENRWYEARFVACGPDRLLGLVRDITEQKEAEEGLKQSEERYREVVESQTELVSRCKPDLTLTFANEAYCRFFGQTSRNLVGRKLPEFLPPELHAKVLRCVDEVIADRRVKVWEHLFTLPDGNDRWVQWTNYAIVDSNGHLKEIQGIGKDITDRKRADEARQNLIHASRLGVVGEFTAMFAHEVNQPLNAILTNSEAGKALLKHQTVPLDDLRAILSDIYQDVLRAGDTIGRMRALSQRREMEMQPLDLNGLIEDVIHLAAGDASRRHVQVRTVLAPDIPSARGDPIHIQHILLNLILNGMDAMRDLPETERLLTIKTESRGGGELLVTVKDAGHGIPAEILPRVFESFFSTKATGMGLGLSIARTIVNAHGGRIWVENNSDRGVAFCFTLPAVT
jgi:PAS domain S-box-containing protein